MEEKLRQIGIFNEVEEIEEDYYAISIKDANEYGKIYSKLEHSQLVDLIDDSSVVTYESSSLQYEGDGFIITLIGDFEENTYKLTIKAADNDNSEEEVEIEEETN